MIALTGDAHGLPLAHGHVSMKVRAQVAAERERREPPAVKEPVRREVARQPWEPRPSRHRRLAA